ncbi:MAG: hypothetical protein LC776_07775, partial [Acidobacteria bacterium]|nr:hypothetical protein [Acidobacteriota bacterium]
QSMPATPLHPRDGEGRLHHPPCTSDKPWAYNGATTCRYLEVPARRGRQTCTLTTRLDLDVALRCGIAAVHGALRPM